jgi:signal peptide peptidase SppA
MKNKPGLQFIAPALDWKRDYRAGRVELDIEARASTELPLRVEGKIGIVTIRGVMEKFTYWSDETSTIKAKRAVNAAAINKKVDNILLVMDSPGGSVDGLGELADAIFQARKVKPVVAQVDGMAASAGYWAVSQANRIFAHEMDMVGSIGVYSVVNDFSKMFEEDGVKTNLITTGDFKGAGTPGTEVTDKQIADFQRIVDTYYDFFLKAIERGRDMGRKKIKPLADGRVFVGQEAVSNGLIDGIQTFEQTLNQMRGESKATPRRDRAARAIRLSDV